MSHNPSNPAQWFGQVLQRTAQKRRVPQFASEYHEYPRPIYTEPRHLFSGEFPVVTVNEFVDASRATEMPDSDYRPEQIAFGWNTAHRDE